MFAQNEIFFTKLTLRIMHVLIITFFFKNSECIPRHEQVDINNSHQNYSQIKITIIKCHVWYKKFDF